MAWVESDKGAVPGTYHNWNDEPVVEGIFKGENGGVVTVEGANRPIRSTKTIHRQLNDPKLKIKIGDRIRIEKGETVGDPPRRKFKVSKWVEDVVPMKKASGL